MPKKVNSEPTLTVWELSALEVVKMLRSHLGAFDGSFSHIMWDGTKMVVNHVHPERSVKETEEPNPRFTKTHKLSEGGAH